MALVFHTWYYRRGQLGPKHSAPIPRLPRPLTHILVLDAEIRLEVVDSGGAGFNSLAQRGATGNDAAEAPWGSARAGAPPGAPHAHRHGTHRS